MYEELSCSKKNVLSSQSVESNVNSTARHHKSLEEDQLPLHVSAPYLSNADIKLYSEKKRSEEQRRKLFGRRRSSPSPTLPEIKSGVELTSISQLSTSYSSPLRFSLSQSAIAKAHSEVFDENIVPNTATFIYKDENCCEPNETTHSPLPEIVMEPPPRRASQHKIDFDQNDESKYSDSDDNRDKKENQHSLLPISIEPETKNISMTVTRRRTTDFEYLQFARDFASACQKRSQFTLLNSNQYSRYLREVVTRGRFSNTITLPLSKTFSPFSPCHFSPYDSTAVVSFTSEDKNDFGCHVVGDLHTYVTNTLRYFDNPDLSDVILVVGEHRFYAHKFALASQSDVFRDMMIVSDRCAGCPDFQKELELSESNDCQKVFPQFLRFFYCGKITFSSETALPLLVLAAKYKVEALRSACDEFIANMIEDGDLKSAVRWLKYATTYQLSDLSTKCVDGAIADNIEELIESQTWLSLTTDCIESIIHSSCLLIPDEFYLFEAVQRWFMNRKKSASDDEIVEDLRKILPHIRFSQMHGTQLLGVEESPIGLHYRSVIRAYLGDAYRYQILARQCSDFRDSQYLPRDYTDKQWCVTMNFHPTRNKRAAPSVHYSGGRWEIQPRRYYDTVNVVIILKKPLETDIKVCISILIYKRNSEILMRLRRKPCVLRAIELTPRPTMVEGTSRTESPASTPRSNSVTDCLTSTLTATVAAGQKMSKNVQGTQHHPHRPPHGPANRLHGPSNGQEYYAIDNIVSDADFQMALSQSGPAGIKLGVIIRTWSIDG